MAMFSCYYCEPLRSTRIALHYEFPTFAFVAYNKARTSIDINIII